MEPFSPLDNKTSKCYFQPKWNSDAVDYVGVLTSIWSPQRKI